MEHDYACAPPWSNITTKMFYECHRDKKPIDTSFAIFFWSKAKGYMKTRARHRRHRKWR